MIAHYKQRALHRSKILQGQLKGLQKMIENEDYCMDIVTQNLAIQKSLSSLNKLVVKNHMQTHVREMFENGDSEKAVEELTKLYELSNVRGK